MQDPSPSAHRTPVNRAEVLRHLALLEDTLGGSGSDGSRVVAEVPWKQLWRLLNLWDQVLSRAREECSQQAAALAARLLHLARSPNETCELDVRNLEDTGHELTQYVVKQQEAVRSAYFGLATHWRLLVSSYHDQCLKLVTCSPNASARNDLFAGRLAPPPQ